MKRISIPIIIILLGAGLFFLWPQSQPDTEVVVSDTIQEILGDDSSETQPIEEQDQRDDEAEEPALLIEGEDEPQQEQTEKVTVQAKAQLDVPFIVQAPNGNWDLPYKEACEEASVLMVHEYYQGTNALTQDEMKTAIDEIIFWGDETFGAFDTTAETTIRYFTEKLGYESNRVNVVYDFTIDDIKALLSKGIPVIIPAAGRELGNKFFQNPGPLYHMLVITGYTNDEFITNDPGTRRGEDYRYDQEVLYNAIHDLTPDLEAISTGQKAMIIVQP